MGKQLIALDLDGPTYEYDRTAQYMLRTYRGAQLHQPSESWDWIQDQVSKADWHWLWSEGVQRGLFRYGHMHVGARAGIEALVAYGYKITIVTHRPPAAVPDTIDWISLMFKGIPLVGLHILSNQEPKTTVEADILIDDKPANLDAWADEGRTAIQFMFRHNAHYKREGVVQCNGWPEVVHRLTK